MCVELVIKEAMNVFKFSYQGLNLFLLVLVKIIFCNKIILFDVKNNNYLSIMITIPFSCYKYKGVMTARDTF